MKKSKLNFSYIIIYYRYNIINVFYGNVFSAFCAFYSFLNFYFSLDY